MNAARILGLFALVGACSDGASTPELPPSTGAIGSAGGRLALDGTRLDIPAGALTTETVLSIERLGPTANLRFEGKAVSSFYRFEPRGLILARQASLSFESPPVTDVYVVWSERGDETSLAPLPTVIDGDRLIANVDHFSIGGLVAVTGGLDGGSGSDGGQADGSIVAPTDAGTDNDAASRDGGPDQDMGPRDSGSSSDAGPSIDAGAAVDSGISVDVGLAPDAGLKPDAGLLPVSIGPASLPDADACVTVTASITVANGVAASWRVLTDAEISLLTTTPSYLGASIDSQGVLSLPALGLLSGGPRATGVEVTLADGRTVSQVWSFLVGGIGSYAVGSGGRPPIFITSPLPDLSRAAANSYAETITSFAASRHPCSGVSYRTDSFCSGVSADGFMRLDAAGAVTPDLSVLPSANGSYCLGVEAVWGPQIILDARTYFFGIVP